MSRLCACLDAPLIMLLCGDTVPAAWVNRVAKQSLLTLAGCVSGCSHPYGNISVLMCKRCSRSKPYWAVLRGRLNSTHYPQECAGVGCIGGSPRPEACCRDRPDGRQAGSGVLGDFSHAAGVWTVSCPPGATCLHPRVQAALFLSPSPLIQDCRIPCASFRFRQKAPASHTSWYCLSEGSPAADGSC